MKNCSWIVALLILLGLTICVAIPVVSVEPVPPIVPLPSRPFEKFGPRIDRLTFKVAGSVSSEAYDLEQGAIDVMDCPAPARTWTDWLANPDITMGDYSELSVIYFALNNARWPLGHGDMLPYGWSNFPENYMSNHDPDLWPTELGGNNETFYVDYNCTRCLDARWFRRAISYLWPSEVQISSMRGAGTPMDSLVFPSIEEVWENPDIPKYPYNVTAAVEALKNGGFQDYDGDKVLEYSPSHAPSWNPGDDPPADMEELPTLRFYIWPDDPDRIFAAMLLRQEMRLIGIPISAAVPPRSICIKAVWLEYEYDIFVAYWDWGVPLPDIYYEGFHSRKDTYPYPWSNNYVRYHSLEFDAYAEDFLTAPTMDEAKSAIFKAQEIFHGDVAVIPAYTYVGYQAHRTNYGNWTGEEKYTGKNWTGFINELGAGFHSLWTYFNVHPQSFERGIDGNCTLRQGLANYVTSFNIINTWWLSDLQVLEQIYEPLIKADPLNAGRYVPWLCDEYTVGTWEHPTAGTCTAVNVTLIPSILWQDATTENPWTLKAEDVGWTFWYMREAQSANYWTLVKDFDSYVIYEDAKWNPNYAKYQDVIELRFSVRSWLAERWVAGVPILPKHLWPEDPALAWAFDPEDHDAVIGTGPFRFFKDGVVGRLNVVPGQFVYLERNPAYFRKLVRPEFYPYNEITGEVGDGGVRIGDFTTVTAQAGYGYPNWLSEVYGPLADVNKDRFVDSDDIMEVMVRMGQTGYVEGYPSYYVDC